MVGNKVAREIDSTVTYVLLVILPWEQNKVYTNKSLIPCMRSDSSKFENGENLLTYP